MQSSNSHLRSVRSFVRRQGRLTRAQKRALSELGPSYFLPDSGTWDFKYSFRRVAPVWLEIGFGNGDTLLRLAQQHPEINFIGIEVHKPGIGHILGSANALQLPNLRIAEGDAVIRLSQQCRPASLQRVLVLFPDPWPKARHHKRRILNPAFVELLATLLTAAGILHLATDWRDYAEEMLAVVEQHPGFINCAGSRKFSHPPEYRCETRFEKRGKALNHDIYDLLFTRA